MTTTPDDPRPEEQDDDVDSPAPPAPEKAGAEVGMVHGEGSTFEPEEDPAGNSDT